MRDESHFVKGVNLMAALAVVICSVLTSCKKSEFSAGGTGGGTARKIDTPAVGEVAQSVKYPLMSNQGAVDIVWAIDTSGSMSEETANVKANFENFLRSLSSKADVRLTLIQQSPNFALGPEIKAKGHKEISRYVGSHNALQIVVDELVTNRSISLRQNAKLVIVVVTDDDARTVTSANFLQMLGPVAADKKPVIYAFRGDTSKPGCQIANKGLSYEQLATQTSGKVFDICEADWSRNFDELVKSVASLVATSFVIEDSSFVRVSSISIDGKDLYSDAYSVSGQTVVLNSSAYSVGAREIEIRYFARKDSLENLPHNPNGAQHPALE